MFSLFASVLPLPFPSSSHPPSSKRRGGGIEDESVAPSHPTTLEDGEGGGWPAPGAGDALQVNEEEEEGIFLLSEGGEGDGGNMRISRSHLRYYFWLSQVNGNRRFWYKKTLFSILLFK